MIGSLSEFVDNLNGSLPAVVAHASEPHMSKNLAMVSPADLEETHTRLIWPAEIRLASLDRVTPFLKELGLSPELIEKYRPALREFTREHQAWMGSPGDDPVAPALSAQLTRMFSRVKDAGGDVGVAELRAFVETSIRLDRLDGQEKWRSTWRILLWRLVRHYQPGVLAETYEIPLRTVEQVLALAKDMADRDDANDERVDQADQKPLVGWDGEVYADYRRESQDDGLSPLDHLKSDLKQRLIEEMWWRIVDVLTPAEMDELDRWGQTDVVVNMKSTPPLWAHLPPSARKRP